MALSRILIIKLSSLGDVIQALPVAAAIRRRFPGANIGWVVGPACADIVKLCRSVDRVITWDSRRPRLPVLSQLRAVRPQVSLDLQGLMRTACLAWLGGARWRIGFRSWQEGGVLLCNLPAITPRTDVHAVKAYLEFAHYLGAGRMSPDFGLELSPQAQEYGAAVVCGNGGDQAQPTVVLLPGTRWETKRWPASHFAALAGQLGERGIRCVVLGGPADREAGAAIAGAAPRTVRDLSGRTSLPQSAGVMTSCALAVGNDSGAIHLAAAMGVPVIALFGPTDPVRTRPYGKGHVVLQAPVPCTRCRRRRCAVSCMERISPQRVLQAVLERLELHR